MITICRMLILLACSVFLITCTRAGIHNQSSLVIKMPSQVSQKSGSVGALSALPSNINCFLVAVGGPEAEMSQNSCVRTGPNPETFGVGVWAGGMSANSEVSINVPSGTNRAVYLAGFEATATTPCEDFRTNGGPSNFSPFFLGKVSGLTLEPGKTVSVPLTVNYDSTDILDDCKGPDFPSGGGNKGPYLRFEGVGLFDAATNTEVATLNECYPVAIKLYENMGNPWLNPGASNINITGLPTGFYNSPSCTGTPPTAVSIPMSSNSTSTFYYKPTNLGLISASSLGFSVSGTTQTFYIDQKFSIFSPVIRFSGANQTIAINQCTQFVAIYQRKESGVTINAPAGDITLNITDTANFTLSNVPSCISSSAFTIGAGNYIAPVYVQFLSPGVSFDLVNQITGTVPSGIPLESYIISD